MKTSIFILIIIFSNILLAKIHVRPKVVYGIDDRMDVYESSDLLLKDLSKSVAAQVLDSSFTLANDLFNLDKRTLADEGMCKTERFSEQPASATCSGFLIAQNLLVTAGHCVRAVTQCQDHSWVFDYANYESVLPAFSFNKDQMFKCIEIVSRVKDNATGLDFAVIKLDRNVIGRRPFKIRKSGKVDPNAVLTVIGFPSGIPLKITTGATVRDNSNPNYFVMNSDTYGGNSGSAVVDTRTGIVEGILVRGDTDFEQAPNEECYQTVKRANDSGRGEDATRITLINQKK
jgi:V8-like Glu-specific endopeptidase